MAWIDYLIFALYMAGVLSIGVTGIVIAAYFSAIMSTADSCLMAASGNFVNDILEKHLLPGIGAKASIRLSMLATLVIGAFAVMLAVRFTTVLDAILYAYAFMVSGLFIPTLGAYFWISAYTVFWFPSHFTFQSPF